MKIRITIICCFLSITLLTACNASNTESTSENVSTESIDSAVQPEQEPSNDSAEHSNKPGGQVLPDGTLEFSQLSETERSLVGVWENGTQYLAIRERALNEDMEYPQGFPLNIICGVGVIDEFGVDGFKITKENTELIDNDGQITIRDTHECPIDGNIQIQAEQIVYDPTTETITYCSFINNEPGYILMPDDSLANEFTFSRTEKDIDSVDWEWYYEASPIEYDPR